ncbi:hypothetical protein ACVXZZ_12555 [Staphylococcus aureus]
MQVPSRRKDITIKEDLIEEVARIWLRRYSINVTCLRKSY